MLNSVIGFSITIASFLICVGSALALGILASFVLSVGNKYTSSWKISIALLPAVVTVVIMMVNGNIGAGLGVAGTFAMVRFRSQPGSAREITGLFFAVSLGLMCGMGYVAIAAIFFAIMSVVILILTFLHFGEANAAVRTLKIVVPENVDYEEVFTDIFDRYTNMCKLVRVRTTNMGTLFELTYDIVLKNMNESKAFIDELRCRNGNLNIIFSRESDVLQM